LTADSPEHVFDPETASFRRSRRRLWKVSQRPPIPTAVGSRRHRAVVHGGGRLKIGSARSGTDRAPGVRRLSVSLGGSLLRDGISGGLLGRGSDVAIG